MQTKEIWIIIIYLLNVFLLHMKRAELFVTTYNADYYINTLIKTFIYVVYGICVKNIKH
jgi:hypothetical protein